MNANSTRGELPSFLRDMLAAPPKAGEGIHSWLFRVARQLHAHLPVGDIVALLENRVAGCGRHVPRAEIVSAVQSSVSCAWQPRGRESSKPVPSKWPAVNQKLREQIINEGYGLADLWEQGKPRIDDSAAHTESIIDMLFPSNPLLCCGYSQFEFDTKPRGEWRGELAQLQFMVPSPMSAVTGQTKDGKESKHSLGNTGSRRFLIVEFDSGTTDQHSALLMHLGTFAPLVCVVHSGGKSLHGWFFVAGQPEQKVRRFFRYAVSLGGDHMIWTPSQFVRMPDGTRDNGNRQKVFYLNFNPLKSHNEPVA